MKIIINATTLTKGGALQVVVSLIREIKNNEEECEWFFALSNEVYKELLKFNIYMDKEHIFVADSSPARYASTRKRLSLYVEKKSPDIIFTVFGPAYIHFETLHLCGIADAWVTHSTLRIFKVLDSPVKVIRTIFLMLYKAYWFKSADAWVVEAGIAKEGLIKRLRLSKEYISIVPNNCAAHYWKSNNESTSSWGDEIKILVFSAYYKHKNIEIVTYIARYLKKIRPNLKFKFMLTLPKDEDSTHNILQNATHLGVAEHIENIGPVSVINGPDLYRRCHICLHPSLLETFSATYPESMAMRMPIVATNLPFARNICQAAALYYEPNDAKGAAMNIIRLIDDEVLRKKLIDNGNAVLKNLPTPKEKYLLYLSSMRDLYQKKEAVHGGIG